LTVVVFLAGWGAATNHLPIAAAQTTSAAAETSPDQGSTDDDASSGVVVGIGGHYRVGRQTAVRLQRALAARLQADSIGRDQLRLETLDGDGVRVAYDVYPSSRNDDSLTGDLGYVVPGSEAAPLTIRRSREDAGSSIVVDTRFPVAGAPNRGPAMIPPGMPWVVSIGDPLGIDEIGLSNVLVDKTASVAVTRVPSAETLPTHRWGYDGVDLVLINSAGLPVLEAMTAAQRDALSEWLRSGGRTLVFLGGSATRFAEVAPWLIEWFPVEEVEVVRFDPAAFETYTASQTPLSAFEGLRLPRQGGRILLRGRTTARVTAALAAEYVVGFGRATAITADMHQPLFAQWPERLDLVTRVVGDLLDQSDRKGNRVDGSTAFNDLAGQMRGVLDQFAIKPPFSFAIASLILMLLIAALGPLDYLLINRVLGKPLLGWLSFPLIAVALSVFLVFQAAPQLDVEASQDAEATGLLRANQFQVLDIDLIDGAGRGFAWSYLYSHDPAEVDVNYFPPDKLASIRGGSSSPIDGIVYPMGYPGREFGGIQLADESTVLPPYRIQPRLAKGESVSGVRSNVLGLTIAPRSSKSIAAEIDFRADRSADAEVIRRPGSELLRGEFSNPLPFDLLDGMLIYGNWVYLLPTRVPAGATVPALEDVRQKNFRWQLTRKVSLEENVSETTPWTPGDFSDRGRVAEMLLFHRAAGGELYTGLRHEVLGGLDLSENLTDDRCILVGRSEEPMFDLVVTEKGAPPESAMRPGGETLSIVRVVLPVRATRLN
jgi:hypothetical protein